MAKKRAAKKPVRAKARRKPAARVVSLKSQVDDVQKSVKRAKGSLKRAADALRKRKLHEQPTESGAAFRALADLEALAADLSSKVSSTITAFCPTMSMEPAFRFDAKTGQLLRSSKG